MVPERQLCWVRPICMVILGESHRCLSEPKLIDLQLSADLLWPLALFRPVLDTEILSFWGKLDNPSNLGLSTKTNRQYLDSFVKLFWQANKDKF